MLQTALSNVKEQCHGPGGIGSAPGQWRPWEENTVSTAKK